jgi:hypothetical protein
MQSAAPHLNLVAAWVGFLLGFLSGMGLGLFFHRAEWLGGYTSLPRRLYRLGHISFFGLGAVNLFFYLSVRGIPTSPSLALASWAFVVGAVAMPLCCLIMAHCPKARLLFTVPVVSLIAGGVLTLQEIIKL